MVETYWRMWDAQPTAILMQGRIEGMIYPVDPQLPPEDLTSRNIFPKMVKKAELVSTAWQWICSFVGQLTSFGGRWGSPCTGKLFSSRSSNGDTAASDWAIKQPFRHLGWSKASSWNWFWCENKLSAGQILVLFGVFPLVWSFSGFFFNTACSFDFFIPQKKYLDVSVFSQKYA